MWPAKSALFIYSLTLCVYTFKWLDNNRYFQLTPWSTGNASDWNAKGPGSILGPGNDFLFNSLFCCCCVLLVVQNTLFVTTFCIFFDNNKWTKTFLIYTIAKFKMCLQSSSSKCYVFVLLLSCLHVKRHIDLNKSCSTLKPRNYFVAD